MDGGWEGAGCGSARVGGEGEGVWRGRGTRVVSRLLDDICRVELDRRQEPSSSPLVLLLLDRRVLLCRLLVRRLLLLLLLGGGPARDLLGLESALAWVRVR